MKRTIIGALLWLGLLVPVRADVSDVRDSVLAAWRSQESAIVTAHFRIRLYRFGEAPATTLSREELHKHLESIESSDPREAMDGLGAEFPDGLSPLYWGAPVEIFVEGVKVSNHIGGGTATGVADAVHVFNGEQQLAYDSANNQASVFAGKSGTHIINVSDLRLLLPADAEGASGQFEVVEESAETITLKRGRREVVADKDSGFIREYIYWADENGEAGGIIRERLQYGPVSYPGGLVFPTIHVNAKYHSGNVQLLNVYLIEDAEFNLELPDDAFTLASPSATQIVDYREDRTKPLQRTSHEDVGDVVEFADAAREEGEARGPGRREEPLRLPGVILGVLLLAWGLLLLRGRWKARRGGMV